MRRRSMQLVSFDVFRTLGFANTTVLKPAQFLNHKTLLQEADWVLFPEYWQLNALVYGLGTWRPPSSSVRFSGSAAAAPARRPHSRPSH